MKDHLENLNKEIYPEINNYLTYWSEDARALTMDTLRQFKVGVGGEKFANDNGQL